MRSLVSIKQQNPRRPCDILLANVGPEIAKTAEIAKTVKTAKCAKKCAKLKMFKNSTFRGEPTKECVSVLCHPVQACSGPEALPSLVQPSQPSPADSSQARAQEPCPAAQRPRESAYHSGSFLREVTGPRSLDSAQGCAQEGAKWPYSPPAHRNCAQTEKLLICRVSENTWKNSKLNILFLLFDI